MNEELQIKDVTEKIISGLSTMEDWDSFSECMELGAHNCEEATPEDGYWICQALHEDPKRLPYEESFPYFDRDIYIHRIYFLKFPDHLQFRDGRVLLTEPFDDGDRELRPEHQADEPTYLYWRETDGKFYITE
ncbi:hypothetical protein [Deinococcus cellulosilyticus]|uniref:Uncharacterized protein n=1 Tax=Deinococcus cellulosilyticus (strain DSM 18568 / NBRC 106333 / KACC 11606 / 5516J-15) TaxID=1223518 RepID=A0A511N474_DEIC1|nr:hypothetical protein [Deinococcus cellulosilyticus]GEM47226.1 hypothetical protein DC3_28610 [Deinococcus cellulosilyticus NBRC 106333 = KACC 11606]